MRQVFFGLVMTLSSITYADSCNQDMYDKIYRKLSDQAVNAKDFNKGIEDRKLAIDNLRVLCNGQRSTYENLSNIGYYGLILY